MGDKESNQSINGTKSLWDICVKDKNALHNRVPVSNKDDCIAVIKALNQAMGECDTKSCMGLAANQIGLAIRACVLKPPEHLRASANKDVYEFWNPDIVEWHGATMNQEWCYSLNQNESYIVKRHINIVVKDDNYGLTPLAGILAYAAQHEIGHLNGKLISDIGMSALDFIQNTVGKLTPQSKNSLCKCGSNKLWKRCCGKSQK